MHTIDSPIASAAGITRAQALRAALILSLGVLGGCTRQADAGSTARPEATAMSQATDVGVGATHAPVTRVTDTSSVCMVNNQYMGRPQIPVTVDGKTYYGCCAGCKARLATDKAVRTAFDPVSHRQVDKATAIIAKTDSGSTLYFENESNLAAYATPGAR